MPETKTFKNVVVTKYGPGTGYEDFWFVATDLDPDKGIALGGLDPKDWDMEVTFTRKANPLAVGDVVKYDGWSDTKTATIMAIDDGQCWLKFSDDSHATWELDDVRR